MTGSQKMYMHARRCTLRISHTIHQVHRDAWHIILLFRRCHIEIPLVRRATKRQAGISIFRPGPLSSSELPAHANSTRVLCKTLTLQANFRTEPRLPDSSPSLDAGSQPIPIHYSHVASGRGEPDDLCMCSKLGENFTMRYNPGKRAE